MLSVDTPKFLIPVLVLMGLLLGLFVMFERSYSHLNDIGLHVSQVQERQRLLAQIVRTVSEMEAAQRGFLLTEDRTFMQPYADARKRVDNYLAALQDNADVKSRQESMQPLAALVHERVEQIEHAIRLYDAPPAEPGLSAMPSNAAASPREPATAPITKAVEAANIAGKQAAIAYLSSGAGRVTMERLRATAQQLEAIQADALVEAYAGWLADLRNTRLAMGGATFLNVLLLGFLGFLAWRAFQRRTEQARELQAQVDSRTMELTALSSHLQDIAEREKQALARELHDALGGLLVATKMDVAWLRSRLPTEDAELQLRWRRIQQSLDQGVDLKRRVVEQLRPTLLDNMGLFTALRWQFQESCNRAGMRCTERLPEIEPRLTNEAAIAVFRVAQESFTNILKHSGATAAWLTVTMDDNSLVLRIEDNGRGFPQYRQTLGPGQSYGGQGLAGMRHRVNALRGKLRVLPREEGGAEIRVELPLAGILKLDGED